MDPSRTGGSVTVEPPSSISSVDVHRAAEEEEEGEENADEQVRQQKQIEFPQSYSIFLGYRERRPPKASCSGQSQLLAGLILPFIQPAAAAATTAAAQAAEGPGGRDKEGRSTRRYSTAAADAATAAAGGGENSTFIFLIVSPYISTKDFVLSGPLILL